MKIYLEVNEILSEQEMLTKQPFQFMVEVQSMEEAIQKFEALKSIISLPQHYEAGIHYCYNDERKPCKFEIIERR